MLGSKAAEELRRLAGLPNPPYIRAMNSTNLMRDPFYAPILFQIESRIHEADKQAVAQGLPLTDSQIRSTLQRLRKTAEGGSPKIPDASPKDKILADLHFALNELRNELGVKSEDSEKEKSLPAADWILALTSVIDSIRLRATGNGSRDYLDFLEGFVTQGRVF